jgi:hypothetical protein
MLGFCRTPRSTWQAFMRGRGTVSLFHPSLIGRAPMMSAVELMTATGLGQPRRQARLSDLLAFTLLLSRSLAVILLPLAALFMISRVF